MNRFPDRDLPPAIWLWFVPVPLLFHLATHQLDGGGVFFSSWVESERGVIENGTALLLIPAALLAVRAAWCLGPPAGVAARVWFAGVAIVCLAFFGEEISWGQHWFGWESPAYFLDHNRQGETNLHNLNIHLGRIAKTLLTLAIVCGGIVAPLWRRRAPVRPGFSNWWYPTMVCVPAATFVLGVRLLERCKTWFDLGWQLLAVNLKETQELYIALFLLIYTWSVHVRMRQMPQAPGASGPPGTVQGAVNSQA